MSTATRSDVNESTSQAMSASQRSEQGDVNTHVPGPRMPAPGTAPGIEHSQLLLRPSLPGSVKVTCIDYSAERMEVHEVSDLAAFIGCHRPDWSHVRWIDVSGLKDMEALATLSEKYELHPLAVEDVLTSQRPKTDDYPATEEHPPRLFVVGWMTRRSARCLCNEQISFFVGRNTLLTFHESKTDLFDPIRQRLSTFGSRIRGGDTSFLFYCLLDALVDNYFPLLDVCSTRLEKLERTVLKKPTTKTMKQIHRVKRELVLLRRSAWGMRDLIHQLHRQPHDCMSEMTRQYLRDVYDHIVQVIDFLETYREIVSGLTDLYMSMISMRMNDVMKTLTIIATIFVPLTFVAGVYGMNMPIPENQYTWMYPAFWGFCLAVAGFMLYWFKRRHWL